MAQLGGSVSRLPGAAMLDLVREGRTPSVISLLAEHHDGEEAARLVERFVAWSRSRALIDSSRESSGIAGRSIPLGQKLGPMLQELLDIEVGHLLLCI